jgi:chorismate synthase
VVGWVSQVGPIEAPLPPAGLTRAQVDATITRCPDPASAEAMEAIIVDAKARGDSWGGSLHVRVEGMPTGLGEPVFGKLKALLSMALGSIGAVTGVVWGPSELEQQLKEPGTVFHARRPDGGPSDVYGGIQGGLSNGEPLLLRVLFKPPATLTDHAKGGRHDPCILPRAVPVAEAMVAMVLADLWLFSLARPHQP